MLSGAVLNARLDVTESTVKAALAPLAEVMTFTS